MRVLMLCTNYPLEANDSYMTNELAGALAAAGHSVQVVVIDWSAVFGRPAMSVRSPDGVEALVISPRGVSGFGRLVEKASKWTLSSLFALRIMRHALRDKAFDLLICFTPCVTVAAPL